MYSKHIIIVNVFAMIQKKLWIFFVLKNLILRQPNVIIFMQAY